MEQSQIQNLLKGNGTAFSNAEWAILKSVITAEALPALPALAEHCARDSEAVIRLLRNRALSAWALRKCPSLSATSEPVRAALAQAGDYEFAACAKRKAALSQLDLLAQKQAKKPIVFKGVANAMVFYEKESLRPSNDIDFILPDDALAIYFPKQVKAAEGFWDWRSSGHLPQFDLGPYGVEAHKYLFSSRQWGYYEDLAQGAIAMEAFPNLYRPSPEVAFTIALLHFLRHMGGHVFDFLDILQISKSETFDFNKAFALWREKELVDLALPPLIVLDSVAPVIPPGARSALFESLDSHASKNVAVSLKLLSSRKFFRFRKAWLDSRVARQFFPWRLWLSLFGAKEITQKRTGLSPKHPAFWYYHLIAFPLKRALLFWK